MDTPGAIVGIIIHPVVLLCTGLLFLFVSCRLVANRFLEWEVRTTRESEREERFLWMIWVPALVVGLIQWALVSYFVPQPPGVNGWEALGTVLPYLIWALVLIVFIIISFQMGLVLLSPFGGRLEGGMISGSAMLYISWAVSLLALILLTLFIFVVT